MTATVKLDEISRALGKEPLCGSLDKEVCGCYAGDLLSWVMSHASYGDVWITIMSNINVLAVASLADTACVILAEGVTLDKDAASAAEEKGINVLSSRKNAYELCVLLHGLL